MTIFTFKGAAEKILTDAGKPLHIKEITRLAVEQNMIATIGKTPEASMAAQLITDVNKHGSKSRFIKTGPSTFAINSKSGADVSSLESQDSKRKQAIISNVSTKQKGDIAEARVAELITLYGDNEVSCFKPISDDEGIDLIVKPKGTLKSLYLQIKSRFGDDPTDIYTASVKQGGVVDHYAMCYLFCYFDTKQGDLGDYVWLVPAPDFQRLANQLQGGKTLGFVAGRKRAESNKWDAYMIEKTDLSGAIIDRLKQI